MIDTHEHYEMLAVLATVGQLSDSELAGLEQHTRTCSACLEAMVDMEQVNEALFVAQAETLCKSRLTVTMQRRFQERARSSGIPLSRPFVALSGIGIQRVAIAALLLAICTTLSWKALIAHNKFEAAVNYLGSSAQSAGSTPRVHELQIASEHSIAALWQRPTQEKRRTLHRRELPSSPESVAAPVRTSFVSWQPAFSGSGMSARHFAPRMTLQLSLPERKAFASTSVPTMWGETDHERSGQRTFHYDSSFASLAFLEKPQLTGATTIPALNVDQSQFRFDIGKTW